jgi:hypothetical protein
MNKPPHGFHQTTTNSILPKAPDREGGGLNAGGASAVEARLRSGSRMGSDMYLRDVFKTGLIGVE